MHRYVGVLLAILAVNSNRVFAAGNIGCLFSDTLCEQEREWCFDDHAFGHCLPHYGHYREEDLHRYELGSDELRLLEQEMQRLFLLGYRWSHTYTQCVLQELLHAIRRKADFDISSCNGDVDQDLEGALRAIEGEELEQVDPRDLAIVRFTPSATDPHSDYADEVYFPPIKDQLLGDDHSSDDQQDDDDDDQAEAGDHQESPTSEPGPNNDMDDYDDSSNYRSPYHYQTPMNPVYRKRSRPDDDVAFQGGGGQITISQLRRIASLLDNLSGPKPVLTEAQERMLFPDGLQTDDLDDQEDLDEGVFGESPTRPMYSEAGLQFIPEVEDDGDMMESAARDAILSNMPQDLHVVPEGLRSMPDEFRNLPGVLDTLSPGGGRNYESAFRNLPEAMRNLPGGLDILPGGYGPAPSAPQEYLGPEPLPVENSIRRSFYMPDSNPFEVEKEDLPWEGLMLQEEEDNAPYQKSPPRSNNKLTALQEAFGPQLNSIRDFEDDYNDYPDYGQLLDEYGEYGQYDAAPRLLLPDRAFPFLQKFDKKDEERAGGDYDDMVQPGARSFLRPERLDVKKPGPGYEVNNYAFDEYASGRDRLGEVGLLLPKLLSEDRGPPAPPQDIDYEANLEEQRDIENLLMGVPSQKTREQVYPDLLLADESFVDEATDDEDISGPRAEKWEDKKEEAVEISSSTSAPTETPTSLVKGPDSYVHIYISGTFKTRKDGDDLAKVVVKLSGLTQDYIDNIDIDTDRVSFKVKENRRGITARDVAKKAGELQGQVESETGQTISEARVGDVNDTVRLMERFVAPTAVSEMVFSSSEKHILTAAAVVCGVMAGFLGAATVLFFLRRHAKSKAKLLGLTAHDTEASKDYQDLCRARMAGKAGEGGKVEPPTSHVPSQRISSLSKDSDNGNNSPSSRSSTSSWSEEPVASNMDISTGHMVLSYMEDHLKNKDRLEQEWIALCAYEAEPCATTLAMKPENNKKNRYPDSVPYDHNRVILNAHANVNGSDYINASSITDHDPRNPAYIATQGPLDTTAADFWQLVWEQGSVVIVMLTRLTENGLAFCHRYWPEEGSDLYHIYEVHLVSEHIWCDDYLVRSFYLKNVKTGETRTVTQFHFLSWPDSGTPASTKALLEFRRKVNKSYRGRSCPIIVHCSNGIGRTGTYSLIDMVLNRMAKGAKEIDIAATLEHIRDQRPHMVKSKAQFEFVLMAVAEEVHAILKALPQ